MIKIGKENEKNAHISTYSFLMASYPFMCIDIRFALNKT